MKQNIILALLIGSGPFLSATAQEKMELKTVKEKASYELGRQLAGSLVPVSSEIDKASLLQGVGDVLDGKPSPMDQQTAKEASQEYQPILQNALMKTRNAASEKNLKTAVDFLAKNKLKAGVSGTDSGLQYEVLKEGAGVNPKATDTVKVHYRGTLIDGTEFDSSYGGNPISFKLNQVIQGWTEGIQIMKPGAKYKFYIPPQLGYGRNGDGDKIGPNSMLIFEVELLGIE